MFSREELVFLLSVIIESYNFPRNREYCETRDIVKGKINAELDKDVPFEANKCDMESDGDYEAQYALGG
jgi:hypothetical protein